ncbi:MAG: hypothetical protein PHZ19_00335 [Candidatus Thermoplasmatota archaeon]|nr:hypothetical protein [Candidatus Thermoplasmatota archaeon]
MKECRVCGCTEDNACVTDDGPCYWVEEDLCSACAAKSQQGLKAWCLACDRQMTVEFEDLEGIRFACPWCKNRFLIEKL